MIGTAFASRPTLEVSGAGAAVDYRLPDDTADLLRLDREMVAFFAERIDREAALPLQLDEIARAILSEDGLHFRYEADGVYDAREAFRRRRGNCLTYSILTVAVARAFGMPARFNEIVNQPRWTRIGGIVMLCRHVNVRVDQWPDSYELDLELDEELLASRRSAEAVADVRAFAGAYTSAGVHRLAAGDQAGALTLLEKATVIDPTEVIAWTNLGTALAKTGEFKRAGACFERALAREPSTLPALSGLAAIHRSEGRHAEAEKLEQAVMRYRERNPYYLLSMALEEESKGNLDTARRHLRRAISIKSDEPEFHRVLAEVTRSLGQRDRRRR